MLPIDIKKIKNHLRVSHDLEDEVIEEYLAFAKSDVIEAVYDSKDVRLNITDLEKDTSFRKAVIMLTSFYYENRLVIKESSLNEMPFSVTHAIQNLRAHRDRYLNE
ncbi:head-tail connector protein [Virgibacillus sp. AGTR]|uniref:head-tail connector protein n=1 Tax=Virgibacillus sp. AGTR TaxID=2812055 RepID=UPI001D160A41|nr:head-tail connector protein [Virgibacillus sp. AGTR]MCC2248854.1 head-tail connector protein [Virgibacillus sp. AGTR]